MKTQEIKRIARFALFGAVGFGIGSLMLGAGYLGVSIIVWAIEAGWSPVTVAAIACVALVFGSAAMGAIGGAGLGWALRNRRKTLRLALWGAIGFGIGGCIWFAVIFGSEWGWIPDFDPSMLALAAIGGAGLGLALKGWQKIVGLALAGFLGFIITNIILNTFIRHFPLRIETFITYFPLRNGVLGWFCAYVPLGIIVGAFLGAAMGILEKGSVKNQK